MTTPIPASILKICNAISNCSSEEELQAVIPSGNQGDAAWFWKKITGGQLELIGTIATSADALKPGLKAIGTNGIYTLYSERSRTAGYSLGLGDGWDLVVGPCEVAGCNPLDNNAHRLLPKFGISSKTIGAGDVALVQRHAPKRGEKFTRWSVWPMSWARVPA